MFNIDLYSRTTPQHPNVIPISKILSSDIFACVVKQQHSVATNASLYRSRIDCVASLYSSRVFTVDFGFSVFCSGIGCVAGKALVVL